MPDVTHRELCDIAARWLKKPLSVRGHGCQIAFTETRTSYLNGESPDAIGFRVSTEDYGGGSTVVECKVSRADFLQDRKKPHRAAGCGMGRFRYYLCPEDMISLQEVPPGWGLAYLTPRKAVRVISGATFSIRNPGQYDCQYDVFSETLLLANLLHRVGDAEKLNERLRVAGRINAHLQRRIIQVEERLKDMEKKYWLLKMKAKE